MKTIRNHLVNLKPAHRDAALTNMNPDGMKATATSIDEALTRAFNWKESPEGYDFWDGICFDLVTCSYNFTEEESAGRALPTDAAERKTHPVYSGFIKYFPHAITAVSHLSYKGNQQHHPDKPLHWDMSKSADELDAMMRHVIDEDWEQVAWRAMSNLERKLTGKCQYENAKK
jgi:hypothetical protein